MKLGRLSRVDIRAVWPHEANDFTPWLAEASNIELLAATLQLGEVEVEATEKDVGRFSADIVARDESGALVLIENQLEQTDHRHLGQVLTYLAGLESEATVVWDWPRQQAWALAQVQHFHRVFNSRIKSLSDSAIGEVGQVEESPE